MQITNYRKCCFCLFRIEQTLVSLHGFREQSTRSKGFRSNKKVEKHCYNVQQTRACAIVSLSCGRDRRDQLRQKHHAHTSEWMSIAAVLVSLTLVLVIELSLTLSTPAVPNCCCSKGSAPYGSSPPFLIFDIRALWRSVLSARAPECQKLKMVG